MTKKIWKSAPRLILSSLLPLFLAVGCAPVNQTSTSSGVLSFKVKWPGQNGGFKIKGIPAETTSIEITITGEGLTEALRESLTRTGGSAEASTRFTLPLGSKTVLANAFDSNQKLLATDNKSVSITGGSTTQVILDLQAVVPVLETNVPLPINLSPTAPGPEATSATSAPTNQTGTTVPLVNPTPFPNLNTTTGSTLTNTPSPTTTTNTSTSSSSSSSSSTTATPAPPTFTAMSPTTAARGATVTLTGTGFSKVNTVFFNGISASFVVNSDTTITATVPVGVTNGVVSMSNGFTVVTGPTFAVDAAQQYLVVDEIFANNDETSNQFIEIRNTSPGLHADASGLQVYYTQADTAGTGIYYQIPTTTPIAPGGKLWVRVNADGTNSNTDVYTGRATYGDIRFDNSVGSFTEVALCKANPCAATNMVDYVQLGMADNAPPLEAAAVSAAQWTATQFVNIKDQVTYTDAANTQDGSTVAFTMNPANNTGSAVPAGLVGDVVLDNINPAIAAEGQRVKRTVLSAGGTALQINAPLQATVQATNTSTGEPATTGLTVDKTYGMVVGDPVKFRATSSYTINSLPNNTALTLNTFIGTNPGSNTANTADGVLGDWALAAATNYFSVGDDVSIMGFTRTITNLGGGNTTLRVNASLDVPILASNEHDGISGLATEGIKLDSTSAATANLIANAVVNSDRVIIAGQTNKITAKLSGDKIRLNGVIGNLDLSGNTGRGAAGSQINAPGGTNVGLFTVGSKVHFRGRLLTVTAAAPPNYTLSDNMAYCQYTGSPVGGVTSLTFASCANGLSTVDLFVNGDTTQVTSGATPTINTATGPLSLSFFTSMSATTNDFIYVVTTGDTVGLRYVPFGVNAKLVPDGTGGSPFKLIPKSGAITLIPQTNVRRVKAFKSVQFDGSSSYTLVTPTPSN